MTTQLSVIVAKLSPTQEVSLEWIDGFASAQDDKFAFHWSNVRAALSTPSAPVATSESRGEGEDLREVVDGAGVVFGAPAWAIDLRLALTLLSKVLGHPALEVGDDETFAAMLIREAIRRLDALADTVGEVTEMSLCEIPRLILHENQLYRFTAASGCKACTDYLAPVPDKEAASRSEATPEQAVAEIVHFDYHGRPSTPKGADSSDIAHLVDLSAYPYGTKLYLHPAPLSEAGGVSEEMVERGCRAEWQPHLWDMANYYSEASKDRKRARMRLALTAALRGAKP